MSYLEGVRTSKLTPLKLTDCKEYCSLVDFASILDGILPVDEMTICQQKRPLPPPVEEEKDNGAGALQLISLPMVMIITLFLTLIR
uniref:Uncharacterized protein n=1 Tax=Bracon brevicornis TaxID=1563983 RepID=A0A6V7IMX2_9HYME